MPLPSSPQGIFSQAGMKASGSLENGDAGERARLEPVYGDLSQTPLIDPAAPKGKPRLPRKNAHPEPPTVRPACFGYPSVQALA